MAKRRRPPTEIPALFELEPESPKQEAPAPSFRKDADQFVDQVMYWLTTPYMTWPGWESVYEHNDNRNKALVHRLAYHKEIFETQQCTEFAAMVYVSTATMVAPPSHD